MNKAVKYLSCLRLVEVCIQVQTHTFFVGAAISMRKYCGCQHSDLSVWTRLSDKYLVREYVKERGLGRKYPFLFTSIARALATSISTVFRSSLSLSRHQAPAMYRCCERPERSQR